MTSNLTSNEKRHLARYQRRKAKRDQKKHLKYDIYDNLDTIASFKSLHHANMLSRRGVSWKTSVQRYQMNMLKNYTKTREQLLKGQSISRGFVEFKQYERGKIRHIRSIHYYERVVQRSLCDNALVPMLSRNVIFDNYACLKDRGTDKALDRMETMLRRFYRKNGNNGWILVFDYKSYFDSIVHEFLYERVEQEFDDKRIVRLFKQLVHPFGFPFTTGNWRHSKKRQDEALNTGKSLGLGSQVSQIGAVVYPNTIDHYIKEKLGVQGFVRYMDDGVMLFTTKEEAEKVRDKLFELSESIGLQINRNKTYIQKISRKFTFLKVRYNLTDSGEVYRQIYKKSVSRERRKLGKLKKRMDDNKLGLADIIQSYSSWKGYAMRRNAAKTVYNMDKYFERLFRVKAPTVKIKNK